MEPRHQSFGHFNSTRKLHFQFFLALLPLWLICAPMKAVVGFIYLFIN